jgi:hypothetical protein
MRLRTVIVILALACAATASAGWARWFGVSRPTATAAPPADTNIIAYWPCEVWTTNGSGEYETTSTVGAATILRLYWLGSGYTRGVLPSASGHGGTSSVEIVNLDNSTRGRFDIISSSLLNGKAACTIEYWVRTIPDTLGDRQRVVSLGTTYVGLQTGSSGNGFRAWCNNTSGSLLGTNVVPSNVWTHVCMTYSSVDKVLALYVGGVLSASTTADRGAISQNANLYYEQARLGSQIDDIRIRTRALASNEVWAIANP